MGFSIDLFISAFLGNIDHRGKETETINDSLQKFIKESVQAAGMKGYTKWCCKISKNE